MRDLLDSLAQVRVGDVFGLFGLIALLIGTLFIGAVLS
jgi:hypothetical protein